MMIRDGRADSKTVSMIMSAYNQNQKYHNTIQLFHRLKLLRQSVLSPLSLTSSTPTSSSSSSPPSSNAAPPPPSSPSSKSQLEFSSPAGYFIPLDGGVYANTLSALNSIKDFNTFDSTV